MNIFVGPEYYSAK